jgi:hypothetical protein
MPGLPRCPNGYTRSKTTGACEKKSQSPKKVACKNATRKNKPAECVAEPAKPASPKVKVARATKKANPKVKIVQTEAQKKEKKIIEMIKKYQTVDLDDPEFYDEDEIQDIVSIAIKKNLTPKEVYHRLQEGDYKNYEDLLTKAEVKYQKMRHK